MEGASSGGRQNVIVEGGGKGKVGKEEEEGEWMGGRVDEWTEERGRHDGVRERKKETRLDLT